MKVKDWGLFWLLGLIWGTSFLWIKIAVTDITPVMLVAFRTLFGAIGLGLTVTLNKETHVNWKTIKDYLPGFLILGLINIVFPWLLISWGSQYIDSGIVAVLNGTMPLFTICLSLIAISDDRITLPKAAGLVVGFAGVVILLSPNLKGGWNASLIYYGAILAAAFCYAFATIFARKKAHGLPFQMQAFLQLSSATIPVWIFALFTEKPMLFPTQWITWLALLWLGLLGSCIAYIIYFYLLHRIGPTRLSMNTYIPPLVGMILGIVFLDEVFYWQALVGAFMILSGIVFANLKHEEQSAH